MSFRPIYEGWDIPGRLSRQVRKRFAGIGLNRDLKAAADLITTIEHKLVAHGLADIDGQDGLAKRIAVITCEQLSIDNQSFISHLTNIMADLIYYEGWFALPTASTLEDYTRSELWQLEDHLRRVDGIVGHLSEIEAQSVAFLTTLITPLLEQHPQLRQKSEKLDKAIHFSANLQDLLQNTPALVEHWLHVPFAPDWDELGLMPRLRDRLDYNLHVATGGVTGNSSRVRTPKLPSRQTSMSDSDILNAYLEGSPLLDIPNFEVDIALPQQTRFEHMHIVAGSGHGKTQTLQHLILHDLETVAGGDASIIVIDSQSDLINTIAGLEVFAPGGALEGRLVLIDPTDIEWPVALNLFDTGLDRLEQYSPLDRERLTNSILELYDFVLGSLLDAGMTQKQTVIFRYITRLLLHIDGATIHTLRELLEVGGYKRYQPYMANLQGSAKAFFETEFNGKEFAATKRQVLRRLYGILENQTFERMFSHPKSKLDLFSEMNAGKVILVNTAKDLLKESGTEIFGRFFIAMIAQAAQERAVLDSAKRLPTYVYIDEASDYFDRNIGLILSTSRKYNVGMILAHQFLGQLDTKLYEAIAANTAIKFAGGVSAKDARTLAPDLRSDAGFIERQQRLSFAAFIKGQHERAVSLAIEPGQMEARERMSDTERNQVREQMRERYAVHYTELFDDASKPEPADEIVKPEQPPDGEDDGAPMKW